MTNQHRLKTSVGLIIILILIVSLFLLFKNNSRQNNSDQSAGSKQEVPFEVETTELGKSQTPSGIPKNMPLDPESRVIQVYEAKTNDGKLQSTKKFTSPKALTQATQFYSDFFLDLDWEGGLSSKTDSQQVSLFQKKDDSLMIVTQADQNKQTTVEITLTQIIN